MKNLLIERIDYEIEKHSLLKHVFYQMWSEGKLTINHLQGYSKEYFQLVKVVPKFVENIFNVIADPSLKRAVGQNLKEESEHIEPWIMFSTAIGVQRSDLASYKGENETNMAVSTLSQLTERSLEEAVAAMYAYEKELPKISRSKIDGLKKFYGMQSNEATKYLEIHEEVDVRHSEVWKNILKTIPEEKQERALNAAISSLEAQNKLLDSVQKNYVV
ncbi:MAG: iron-containing redox enzyme family protein [Thermoproteota archaeon]|jgi:pyrroloquinoline-quinone synthase|nr:iron-containing redox enzyme family protein [Thermoproteota archaeon]MDQ3983903.1 iron-containing redox enzyme family protein [Thermoproteota archaeon]